MVAVSQDLVTNCITCKFNEHFYMNPANHSCLCVPGFHLVGGVCEEICGDGKSLIYKCDDGGSEYGDGCSEVCAVEEGFYCSSGNASSKCRYFRYDIVLQLESTAKISLENKAIFSFSFSPKLFMEKLLNGSGSIILETNRSLKVESVTLRKHLLSVQVEFFEDLEDFRAIISVDLTNKTFDQTEASLNFVMQRDGLLVIVPNLFLLRL